MLLAIPLLFSLVLRPQTEDKQGLKIIWHKDSLDRSVLENPLLEMVDIKLLIPGIKFDLAYAKKSNFTKKRMYPKNLRSTYLRKLPALALKKVAEELSLQGLGILIWDAYRPFSVTQQFWDLIRDERYVANPNKGSAHNKGTAVDLTLYDLASGKPIDMPTDFDDFSEKSHHGNLDLSEKKINNREILKSAMEKNGFIKFETEWWHYSWPSAPIYDVLDIPFSKLKD